MRASSSNESTVSGRIIKIAIAAIAIGMVMMLIAMGTSLGLQKEIKAKTIALSGDIRIAPFENNNSSISITPIDTLELRKERWWDKAKVAHLYPYVSKGVLLKTKSEFEGAVVKGVDAAFPWEKLRPYLMEGSFPVFDSVVSKDLVLSQTLAQKLQLNLGDRVTAYFQNNKEGALPRIRYFTLTAIYQTGFPDFDNSIVFADIKQIQRLNNWTAQQIGGMELFLTPQSDPVTYAEKIYRELPPHIDVQRVDQLYEGIFDWIALFDFNVLIILIVMILVGTLNMTTALLVLILERSRMVGVLKSMGARNGQIQCVFLWNAVYIIIRGLVYGNAIGLTFLMGQSYFGWVQLDPVTYFVSTLPVLLPIHLVVGLNLFVLIVCSVLLWIPSFIVGRVDPTEVVRFR
ncbi:MAG: ABC transporter permease [Flavobacteriaceae bacterium]